MNKKIKLILSASILVLLVVSLFGVFILAQELINEKQGQDVLVRRTASSNIYDLGNNTFRAEIHSSEINMKDMNGEYKPYEEITIFTSDDDKLILKWNNKSVFLNFYSKGIDDVKIKFKDKSLDKKNKLKFKTNIQKNKGNYYFNHTLDKANQPKKFGYDIVTENVSCVFENLALICDEQKIDFSEAYYKQNISIIGDSLSVELEGDDLSYIDPVVQYSGGKVDKMGYIKYDEPSTYTYSYGDMAVGCLAGCYDWISRGFALFGVNALADYVIVDSSLVSVNLNQAVKSTDNQYGYDLDEGAWGSSPYDDEYSDLGSGNTYFSDITWGRSTGVKVLNLNSQGISDLKSSIGNDTEFGIGFKNSDEDDNDNYLDINYGDIYLNVTYHDPVPTTTHSATSPPGGASYNSNTWTNETIQHYISCDSECDYVQYCTDTANTCSPSGNYGTDEYVNVSTEGISYFRWRGVKNGYSGSTSTFTDKINTGDILFYVNNTEIWNYNGYFNTTETTNDFSQELNDALETCIEDAEGYCTIPLVIHSDSAGKINISDINIYFNVSEYIWNVSNLPGLSTYKTRVKATDGLLNSGWDESNEDFIIEDLNPPNDTYKFNIKNSSGNIVAWLGDEGNIVLKGTCIVSSNCVAPQGSFIFSNSSDSTTAYLGSDGNLCIEKGDCSDQSATCTNSRDAFRVLNDTTSEIMSYIDIDGELCLTGRLYENSLK